MLPLNTRTSSLFVWTHSSFCFLISHVWHGYQSQFLHLPISVLKTVSMLWTLLSNAPPAMADQSRWWGRNNNIDGIDKKPFETIPSVSIGKRFGFFLTTFGFVGIYTLVIYEGLLLFLGVIYLCLLVYLNSNYIIYF